MNKGAREYEYTEAQINYSTFKTCNSLGYLFEFAFVKVKFVVIRTS